MKNRKIKIVFLFMVFVFGIGIFFHEFMAVSAETRYRAKHVRGTYEGYFETSQGSKVVTRKAKIVISYCDEEGNFSGTFLITDGKPGECSIEGMVDFSTGEITIKQTKWIHSSSGLSLRTYIGTLNFIDGVIYGQQKNSNRQFELTKINGTIHSLTKESIPKYWIGEYDGRYSGSTVRRGYALSITDINDDGSFTGIGVISKKENALHQVSGSYYLTGEINFSTGYIKYKGNKWIQRADSNFTFIQMIGVINKGVIAGYTENGTVDMFATSKEIPMTSFEVDKEDLNIKKGESEKISIIWNPISTTYDKEVKWTSSNKKIATVDRGIVTGVSEGICEITAQIGELKANCSVTVFQSGEEAKQQNFNEMIITVYQSETGADEKENKYSLSEGAIVKIGGAEYRTSPEGRVKIPMFFAEDVTVSKKGYCTRVITAHQFMISQTVYLQKESEYPVIEGVWINDIDVMNNEYPVSILEEDKITLTADINWGKSKYGKIELIQAATSAVFTKNSLSMVLKDQFDVSDDLYLKATNIDGKINIKKLKIEAGGKLPDGLDFSFSMGDSTDVELPDSWPFLAENKIKIDVDTSDIPIKVSIDNHKIYVAIGMDINSFQWKHDYKQGEDNDKKEVKNIVNELKNIFSTENENDKERKVKTFKEKYEDGKKTKGSFCFSADFNVMGFAEMYMDNSNELHLMDGGVVIYPSISYEQSGQFFVGSIPLYWEFAIKDEIEARLNLYRESNAGTFLPKGSMEGLLEGSIGGGVGINDMVQAGIGIDLKFKPYIDFGRSLTNFLKLTTEFGGYIKAKLAFFEYKKVFPANTWVLESQLVRSARWVSMTARQQTDDRKMESSIYNIDSYVQQDLGYLNKKSEFKINSPQFHSFQMGNSQENVKVFKTNTYTEANPLIGEFSDGKAIAVWVDSETESINDIGIYVSIYNGEQWEKPFALDDDGTFGNDPCLKIIDDVAYIAWQDAEIPFSEKDDLNSIAGYMGISAAKYDKEEGYFVLYDVTSEDGILDMNPVICGDSEGVCLVWVNNTENSWFGTNKKNNIMVSRVDEEAAIWGENIWEEPEKLYGGINSINGFAADYTLQELNVAYCVDQDNNLGTIDDLEIYLNRIRMTNNIIADTAPVFSNHKLYFYSDGTINEMDFSLEHTWRNILPEEVSLGSDDYKIINNGYNKLILYTKESGIYSGLYGIFYDQEWGCWGEPVLIYQGEQRVDSFDGIWSQDGVWEFILCTKEIKETGNDSELYEKADLVLLEKLSCSDIEVKDVFYDESDFIPGSLAKFKIEVTNKGMSTANYTSVELADKDGFLILETVNNEPILPGETKKIEVSCVIGNEDVGNKINVAVESESEGDDTDNVKSIAVMYSDVALEGTSYGLKEDGRAVIYANLVNKGNYELKNITVSLREDSLDGRLVAQKTWKSLKAFTTEEVAFYETYQEEKVYYLTISGTETDDDRSNDSDYVVFLSGKADEEEIWKTGDINDDRVINSSDALMVLKFAAGLLKPSDEQKKAADVNKDGEVNSSDALSILKYAAKLITEF